MEELLKVELESSSLKTCEFKTKGTLREFFGL